MRLCSINELKEHDILARDVMADNYNVFLYKNTILNKKYIEKLKELGIPYVYIQDNIPEEEVAVLKKEIEEKSRSKVKEIILKHTYNSGSELQEISKTADNIIVNILEEEEVIENIYDIKERSADVYTHSISICVLATLVALKLGLDKERVHDIGVGCLLHDLGLRYMMIEYADQDIETLSKKELVEYKKHPVYGYTALKNENWLSKKSKEIILCHHEKIDGSGYPLHATEISIDTKIVSVCDTFDEMICGIGRKRMKIYEAVEYLKSFKNILFDGRIVDALLEFTAVYPSGSVVVTNEGFVAVVIKQNKHFPERPIIQITRDKFGNPVEEDNIIDLVKVNNIFIDSVLE
ncbi:MAG: HD domain-containing protein [Lachnospiraceae bacterium]|nr:HD domain-containing protein [Lachnospiraceae bacterium]